MRTRSTLPAVLLALLLVPDVSANPVDLRAAEDQYLGVMTSAAFLDSVGDDGQIASIDLAVDDFRSKASLTREGVPKLEVFYNGISADPKDPRLPSHLMRWKQLHPHSPTPYVIEAHIKLAGVVDKYNMQGVSLGDIQSIDRKEVLIEQLRAFLAVHQRDAGADPHWDVVRIRLAVFEGLRGSSAAALINDAIDRFPHYKPLYGAAADMYLPRWGGSAEELELWARELELKLSRTGIPGGYALTYLHAFEHEYGNGLLSRSNIDWERFETSWRHVELRGIGTHYQAIAAMAACVAGDHSMSKRLFERAAGALDGTVSGTRPGRKECVDWSRKSRWQLTLEEAFESLWALILFAVGMLRRFVFGW